MKPLYRWIAAITACLLLAAGAYLSATALIDSLSTYRSPLSANPPAPAEQLGQPATRRLVFVLIDALRADTAADPAVMPTLAQLREQGASLTLHSRPPSFSQPGYTTLLTGAWPDFNDGPAFNVPYEDVPTFSQDNLFSAAKRAGLKTAVSGYYWFEKLIPADAVDYSFYTPGEDAAADREVVDAALPWLAAGDAQLVLIHIDQVDYAGHHEGGPRDPNWNAAAARSDALLAEILAQLDLKKDTILVVSDHGQIDAGGHGGTESVTLREPLVMAGASVSPGQYADAQMVDLAPTLAALLGLNLPASGQGQPLTDLLYLPPATRDALPIALTQQHNELANAYANAIGEEVYQAASPLTAVDDLRAARLTRERLPRIALSIPLALLPLALYIRRRKAAAAWPLAAALLYLGVFHLRYAVIAGRSYSYSSIISPTELVTFVAAGAGLALLLAALLNLLGSGGLRRAPRAAAGTVMEVTAVTLWALALFLLWHYAMNGLLPVWTLPDFTSQYQGLLALIQILVVALVGPLLAGLAALAVAAAKRPRAAQQAPAV